MRIMKSQFEILSQETQDDLLKRIEVAARTCYKSEDKISEGSAERIVKALIGHSHDAMLEHGVIAVRLICDRGVSHELVRHRLAAYAQESTRYVNYEAGITVIEPTSIEKGTIHYLTWQEAMIVAENAYRKMINDGCSPQVARAVLPTCLKTEVVITTNIREWRHILKLRGSWAAHPDIRHLMRMVHKEFVSRYPVLFGDIEWDDK